MSRFSILNHARSGKAPMLRQVQETRHRRCRLGLALLLLGVLSACLAACGDDSKESTSMDGGVGQNDGSTATPTFTNLRLSTLQLVDPHLVLILDATNTVNNSVADSIEARDLNVIIRISNMGGTSSVEVHSGANCQAGTPLNCSPGSEAPRTANVEERGQGQTCFEPVAGSTTDAYTDPNSPVGPCFRFQQTPFVLTVGGIPLTLDEGTIAASYSGSSSMPTGLTSGVIAGFVSQATAQQVMFPSPLGGGNITLSSVLPQGDADTLNGTEGWWVYFNFTAEPVNWSAN